MKIASHNSPVVIYNYLLSALIERDLFDLWDSNRNLQRDVATIKRRSSEEGITFLTKVLPVLGKALDCALAKDLEFCLPPGFSRREGEIPKLFGDLFLKIFTIRGQLLPLPCHRSVAGIRQLAYMFYKLQLPSTHEQTRRVLREFVEVDESLPKMEDSYFADSALLNNARKLIASVVNKGDFVNICPRHGPGSVATGECSPGKSKFSRIYADLEAQFPFTEYFRFSASHVCDTLDEIQRLELLPHSCAKVVLVPKDSRGPRLISMEPLEKQWIQQGIQRELYDVVERHPLTRGHVCFRDQSVNRDMAHAASIDGAWVTLDMQEASDRVSLPLFKRLFEYTKLYEPAMASRSKYTELPDGNRVLLNKFASMGSALCFPVEALVFWSLSVAALQAYSSLPLRFAASLVYVYGDDLIVPHQYYEIIMSVLERYALRFNQAKCCTSKIARFRESCGLDVFRGTDVTPIRIKKVVVEAPNEWLPSWVEQSNLSYQRGFHGLADAMEDICRLTDIPLLVTEKKLGILSFIRPYAPMVPRRYLRFNRKLHRREVRGISVCTKPCDPLYAGYDEMLRNWSNFLSRKFDSYTVCTRDKEIAYSIRHTQLLRMAWTPLDV